MSKWYLNPGSNDDIVLSTRIRLARNLSSLPFQSRMTPEQKKELCQKVRAALQGVNLGENKLSFIEMNSLSDTQRLALVETHTISPEFMDSPENKLLVLSKDEDISIMVGEEDHIRIQVMRSGLELNDALKTADLLDNVLDETLDYAFSEQLGFLTACPTNLGTGLRASVMLHLPALEQAGAINQLARTISKLGLTIRGTYGEGSDAKGAQYQISNQITLGISEEMAVQNLQSMVEQVIAQEKNARKAVWPQPMRLEDIVWRSLGLLQNARMISGKEAEELLSYLRLGVSMGILPGVTVQTLNGLSTKIGAGALCRDSKKNLSPDERDEKRAAVLRQELQTAGRT